MIITLLRCCKYFKAFPAYMSFATSTFHMIASTILDNSSLALWTLSNSHLLHRCLVIVFFLPLLACIVWMTLVAFKAFYFATDLTIDLSFFLNILTIKNIFTVLACQKFILMYLKILTYFDITDLLKLFF